MVAPGSFKPAPIPLRRLRRRCLRSHSSHPDVDGDEHEALYFLEQRFGFVVIRPHDLRRFGDAQAANRPATVMNCDRVRKLGPGERVGSQDVVKKLYEFIRVLADVADPGCCSSVSK